MPVDRPAYMHSFAMTERHLVLAEFPLVVNPVQLLTSGKPFIRNYRWEPERGTRFQVFDWRTGAHQGTWTGPALFAFHHINAFVDEDGAMVLDLAGYDDPGIIDDLYVDPLREGSPDFPRPLPAEPRAAPHQPLPDGAALPHRLGNRQPGTGPLHRRPGPDRCDHGRGPELAPGSVLPGEPVFVPRPRGAARREAGSWREGPESGRPDAEVPEDDGVLLSVVLDAANATSFLLVLDAATLEEVGRATVPHALPLGFHGEFCSAE